MQVLDFFIVNVSLVCLFAEMFPALRPLKSLRILRVLRPLRLLARDPGMRLIITALVKVMPSVTEVFGVLLAVMMVFAILSLQLFSDSFGSCSDDSYTTRESCLAAAGAARRLELGAGAEGPWLPPASLDLARLDLGSRRELKGGHDSNIGATDFATSDSTMAPWLNPAFGSFDSFGSAMLLLYIMSTGDGWEDVMYQGMDAVGPGSRRYATTSRPRRSSSSRGCSSAPFSRSTSSSAPSATTSRASKPSRMVRLAR